MRHPFALTSTTECTCTHVNIREESHGDEKVLAVDLAFQIEGSNELLDHFHPGLREGFYCNKAADDGQVELDEKLAVLPNLRVVGLPDKIRWGGDDKFSGYRLIADYGLGDDSNIDLTSCVVGKKWVSVKEGGTSIIGWRVSYAGESLQDVMTRGKLAGLKGQKAFIQLHAPAVLQLVKGGKGAKSAAAGGEDDGQDLLTGGEGEGDGDGDEEVDTPEAALARAAGGE